MERIGRGKKQPKRSVLTGWADRANFSNLIIKFWVFQRQQTPLSEANNSCFRCCSMLWKFSRVHRAIRQPDASSHQQSAKLDWAKGSPSSRNMYLYKLQHTHFNSIPTTIAKLDLVECVNGRRRTSLMRGSIWNGRNQPSTQHAHLASDTVFSYFGFLGKCAAQITAVVVWDGLDGGKFAKAHTSSQDQHQPAQWENHRYHWLSCRSRLLTTKCYRRHYNDKMDIRTWKRILFVGRIRMIIQMRSIIAHVERLFRFHLLIFFLPLCQFHKK